MTSSDRAFRAAHLLSPNTLAFWNLRALRPHYPQRKCHSQAALGRQDQLSAHCGPSPLGAARPSTESRAGPATSSSRTALPACPRRVWTHTPAHATHRDGPRAPRVGPGGCHKTLHVGRPGLEGREWAPSPHSTWASGDLRPCSVRPLALPDTPPPSCLLPPYTSLNPTRGLDVQPVSQASARAGPSPGLLLPLFIRLASVCTFYTFSSNAPSSRKPPLPAPGPREAGAGAPSDFKSKHPVLIILGSLALDPGPKAWSVVGLWERFAESAGISRGCKEAMMHAEVSALPPRRRSR